jgi:hypothetical protein
METQTHNIEVSRKHFVPWNKGRVTGQKPPLKPREVWAIKVRLQILNRVATWRSSTWRSIANYGAATSFASCRGRDAGRPSAHSGPRLSAQDRRTGPV